LEEEKLKKLEADQKDRWQRGSPPKGNEQKSEKSENGKSPKDEKKKKNKIPSK